MLLVVDGIMRMLSDVQIVPCRSATAAQLESAKVTQDLEFGSDQDNSHKIGGEAFQLSHPIKKMADGNNIGC